MAHRETGIAVCGLILGTMIGAGFVAGGRDTVANLTGIDSEFLSYREGVVKDSQYRRRTISEKDKRTRPRAQVRTFSDTKPQPVSQVQNTEEVQTVNFAECESKVRIARELEALVIPLIPSRPMDQLVRSSIQDVFASYRNDCLPYVGEETSSPSAEKQAKVRLNVQRKSVSRVQEKANARCYQFTGARRSRCIVRSRGY